MDIHGSTAETVTGHDWMAADVKGGVVKIFHFAGVINE